MPDFLRDLAVNPLLLPGLLGCLVASLACGVIGPLVVARRQVFLVGAIAHITIGGLGAAIFLRHHLPGIFGWLQPLHGAVAAAVLAAVLVSIVVQHTRERIDTLLGAMWAVGMSCGILLVKFTPGYHVELTSYLFGDVSVIAWDDVVLLAVLAAIVIGVVALLYKRLLALCIDEEYAALQGAPVLALNIVLTVLIALCVVTLVRIVGLILVIALLALPPATVGTACRRMLPMMLWSILLTALLTTLPRIAVYGTRVAPEPAIVLSAAGVYLVARVVARWRT